MSAKENKLTKKHLAGYLLGDLGECMTFSIMGSFLTRYYVNVALIDTAVLAIMTLIWKIWDAASNPIIGMFMDKMFAKNKHKEGKFRPWMLRTTPLLAITAIIVFTAPSFVDGMSKLVVVFVTYLLYEMVYNMFSIPYGSLLSAMSENEEERAQLSSARGIGGMTGNLIPTVLFPIIIAVFESNPELGYGVGVTICAVIGFVCCLMSYYFTEERCSNVSKAEVQESKITDIFEVIQKNRAFVGLSMHGVFQGAMQAIGMTMGTYMFSDVLGSLALMSISNLCVMPVSMLFLFMAPRIVKKIGTDKLIKNSLLIGAGIYVLLFVLMVLTDINPGLYIILSGLGYGFVGASGMMQWSLVGETIDYNEYLTGKRTEGTIYGTFNMVRRVGQAIGSSFSVALLGWIGYDVALSNAGLAQSATTILGIKVLCILVPAFLAIGSWVAFRFVWYIKPEYIAEKNKSI